MNWRTVLGLPEKRDSLENPSVDLLTALGVDELESFSGVSITPEKALTFSAVYGAVRLLSEDAASLPFHVYKQQGRSRVREPLDPRDWALNDEANPEMDAFELRELTMGFANLHGISYQYVERSKGGKLLGLWPLRPDRTFRHRTPSGQLAYATTLDNGETRVLFDHELIVIKAFLGMSPVKLARQTIGLALAAEEFGGRFFSNDARPGGVVETDAAMDVDQVRDFKRAWEAGHKGLKRSHLLGILTNGGHWKDVGVPPGDAQFLETRKFEVQEVARFFRVPASLLEGDKGGSLQYSTVEMDMLAYVVHSLRPWLVRVEKATKRRLFRSNTDRAADRYPEHQLSALLRGDDNSRSRVHATAIQNGWMNRAEVRELENLPEILGAGLEDFVLKAADAVAVDDDAKSEELVREVLRRIELKGGSDSEELVRQVLRKLNAAKRGQDV